MSIEYHNGICHVYVDGVLVCEGTIDAVRDYLDWLENQGNDDE